MNTHKLSKKARRSIVLALIVVIGVGSASAGLLIATGDGMFASTDGGVTYAGSDGIPATAADQLLTFGPNGITAPTTSGIIPATAADSLTYTGPNGITATAVDRLTMAQVSGMTLTGVDGVIINSSDNSYHVDSVFIHQASGITATAVDNLKFVGVNGITATAVDTRNIEHANGLMAVGVDGLTISFADGITATAVDGRIISISSDGLTISGVAGITATAVDDIFFTGADLITMLGLDELLPLPPLPPGLRSVAPDLAALLNEATDDSNVNAFVVYHHLPTDADIATLRGMGILLGQRYRVLPMVSVTTTKAQLMQVSRLPGVRAIYGNRTVKLFGEPGNGFIGTERLKADPDLTAQNGGLPIKGRGVTVAVLDTGIDGTHGDFAGRVKKNVKLVGLAGLGLSFSYPLSIEGLPNTDLVSGHGTFVAGVVAGDGTRSNGKYTGVAPGADLVGLSVGDLSLLSVIEGFDYLLWKGPELGVRVVNCSFSAAVLYDPNDPVNIATKMLDERGVNVVFSAGNTGPGMDTLNPYAMAPWVTSVGATDESGRLAGFSSRGSFTKLSGPTLVAPGVNVVSTRALSVDLAGTLNLLLGGDLTRLSLTELPFYTVSNGTSFTAPQVAGTIALMLEANPSLTPAQVRDILQRTATPMPPYYRFEVGAGMLNAHAAVLEAAFPERRMGMFRAAMDRGQARFVNDPLRIFTGSVKAGATHTSNITIPQNSLLASVQIAWGPELSTHDLA
ncbi:MAG: S8 family serine peptidase, partial [Blastocatellia bacterium]